ncbi:unnamed protein product [Prorocentrum cordatum]|uniref:Uncharacterized protein n=1 Tax=Prorocentrum cordatum TaxID=2364126 RepID=A0ABN9YBE5_9DINO|nr:unnamed protein product [Polarella glacialis]
MKRKLAALGYQSASLETSSGKGKGKGGRSKTSTRTSTLWKGCGFDQLKGITRSAVLEVLVATTGHISAGPAALRPAWNSRGASPEGWPFLGHGFDEESGFEWKGATVTMYLVTFTCMGMAWSGTAPRRCCCNRTRSTRPWPRRGSGRTAPTARPWPRRGSGRTPG